MKQDDAAEDRFWGRQFRRLTSWAVEHPKPALVVLLCLTVGLNAAGNFALDLFNLQPKTMPLSAEVERRLAKVEKDQEQLTASVGEIKSAVSKLDGKLDVLISRGR